MLPSTQGMSAHRLPSPCLFSRGSLFASGDEQEDGELLWISTGIALVRLSWIVRCVGWPGWGDTVRSLGSRTKSYAVKPVPISGRP